MDMQVGVEGRPGRYHIYRQAQFYYQLFLDHPVKPRAFL